MSNIGSDVKPLLAKYDKHLKCLNDISNGLIGNYYLKFHKFEDIAKELLQVNDSPKAVDMVAVDTRGELYFIEFKNPNINIQYPVDDCSRFKHVKCGMAKKCYIAQQNEIVSSIKLKAVESWMIVEELFLANNKSLKTDVKCHFYVVIDPLEVGVGINNELAGKKKNTHIFSAVKNGINRYIKKRKVHFYFDTADVVSTAFFMKNIVPKLIAV